MIAWRSPATPDVLAADEQHAAATSKRRRPARPSAAGSGKPRTCPGPPGRDVVDDQAERAEAANAPVRLGRIAGAENDSTPSVSSILGWSADETQNEPGSADGFADDAFRSFGAEDDDGSTDRERDDHDAIDAPL